MGISILYRDRPSEIEKTVSDETLSRLLLGETFCAISTDSKKREYFFDVLKRPLTAACDINFRQEVINDFVRFPQLFEELHSLAARFSELEASYIGAKRERRKFSSGSGVSKDSAKNVLRISAVAAKRALLFVKAFGDLLSEFDIKSDGLKRLLAACEEIFGNSEFGALTSFCSKYESFSERGYWDFRWSVSQDGNVESFDLVDHRFIRIIEPQPKRNAFRLVRKTETIYRCELIYPQNDEYLDDLAVSGILNLCDVFSEIFEQLFNKFGEIKCELDFYSVAYDYVKFLLDKNVPAVYPVISNDGSQKARKLYDINLLVSLGNASRVVPNDLVLGNNGGLIILGDNGSGKTVYLRSVASMQLLAQSGLPVPCEEAEITTFSQITAHFAESEGEVKDVGRFENEVREVSETVDSLAPDSAVFLNEIFQSTAYSEGADALYNLLKYFDALNIRWVLVTHLNGLADRFGDGEVNVKKICEGFKII